MGHLVGRLLEFPWKIYFWYTSWLLVPQLLLWINGGSRRPKVSSFKSGVQLSSSAVAPGLWQSRRSFEGGFFLHLASVSPCGLLMLHPGTRIFWSVLLIFWSFLMTETFSIKWCLGSCEGGETTCIVSSWPGACTSQTTAWPEGWNIWLLSL